jgi:hypothetical protein
MGTTPLLKIAYPEPTDPVNQGAAAMKTIATGFDQLGIFGQQTAGANAAIPVTQASVTFASTPILRGFQTAGPGGMTVSVPGWYLIYGGSAIPTGTANIRLYIGINAVAQSLGQGAVQQAGAGVNQVSVQAAFLLAAGDVIGLRVSSTVATTFQGSCVLTAQLVALP